MLVHSSCILLVDDNNGYNHLYMLGNNGHICTYTSTWVETFILLKHLRGYTTCMSVFCTDLPMYVYVLWYSNQFLIINTTDTCSYGCVRMHLAFEELKDVLVLSSAC